MRSGTAAVMLLVSLALVLAARPAVLLFPQMPLAMSADERLALLRFLADLAAATGINILVMHGSMNEEELLACHNIHHEQGALQLQAALHGLQQVCTSAIHSSCKQPDSGLLSAITQVWVLWPFLAPDIVLQTVSDMPQLKTFQRGQGMRPSHSYCTVTLNLFCRGQMQFHLHHLRHFINLA